MRSETYFLYQNFEELHELTLDLTTSCNVLVLYLKLKKGVAGKATEETNNHFESVSHFAISFSRSNCGFSGSVITAERSKKV
jgi:hypothetical protein